MREEARGELASDGPRASPILRAETADTCLRVALAVEPPAHVWLTDARGDTLSDEPKATDAALAPHGPVCVRKGEAVTLHVEGPRVWSARFVAWASP